MPRPRREPPRRGVPFYDVDAGRMRILPAGGPGVVDYVGPREGFDARRALRRSGMAAREEARTSGALAARGARGVASTAGFDAGSWANVLMWMLATLVMLGLLRAALEGRGPAAIDKTFGWLGGAWQRFLSPADPLVGKGAAGSASAGGGVGAATTSAVPTITATRTGRLVPVPTNLAEPGVRLDSGTASLAEQLARRFNVKISSGFRDPAHNAEVGGAPQSDHLCGGAADFVGSRAGMDALQRWAEAHVGHGQLAYVEPVSQTGGTHVHISFFRCH